MFDLCFKKVREFDRDLYPVERVNILTHNLELLFPGKTFTGGVIFLSNDDLIKKVDCCIDGGFIIFL
jgi:hypothetical protein